LRELEILQRVFYRVRQGRHIEIAVYRFRLARQEAFRSDVFMDNIAPSTFRTVLTASMLSSKNRSGGKQ
jgi:hypothetical protein